MKFEKIRSRKPYERKPFGDFNQNTILTDGNSFLLLLVRDNLYW